MRCTKRDTFAACSGCVLLSEISRGDVGHISFLCLDFRRAFTVTFAVTAAVTRRRKKGFFTKETRPNGCESRFRSGV